MDRFRRAGTGGLLSEHSQVRSALRSLILFGAPLLRLLRYARADVGAESPDFILNVLDYYTFFTYSMFLGQVRG